MGRGPDGGRGGGVPDQCKRPLGLPLTLASFRAPTEAENSKTEHNKLVLTTKGYKTAALLHLHSTWSLYTWVGNRYVNAKIQLLVT